MSGSLEVKVRFRMQELDEPASFSFKTSLYFLILDQCGIEGWTAVLTCAVFSGMNLKDVITSAAAAAKFSSCRPWRKINKRNRLACHTYRSELLPLLGGSGDKDYIF